jgi:hypothetical protein
MKRLRILTFSTVVLAALIFFYQKRTPTTIAHNEGLVIKKEWLAVNQNPITPKQEIRPGDQTFLTFPEWFLVFSPEEQANYFKKQTATSFPFMSHTRQIWESYRIINSQIKDDFPRNNDYHFMIWVIGTSASVEYSIKAGYETLIGRMTDTYTPTTDEDKFNAQFAQDYVTFIKDRPWYEFDFKNRLTSLWTETSFFGDNFLRKIERKYMLTSELLVKWAYGKLIGLGSAQVYEEALPTTSVVLQDNSIVNLPRYDKFNQAITDLAKQGKSFKEIAGNTSAILLTILVPTNKVNNLGNSQTVFSQPISSDSTMQRIALVIPVEQLNILLTHLYEEKIIVEHIFDY